MREPTMRQQVRTSQKSTAVGVPAATHGAQRGRPGDEPSRDTHGEKPTRTRRRDHRRARTLQQCHNRRLRQTPCKGGTGNKLVSRYVAVKCALWCRCHRRSLKQVGSTPLDGVAGNYKGGGTSGGGKVGPERQDGMERRKLQEEDELFFLNGTNDHRGGRQKIARNGSEYTSAAEALAELVA